MHRGGKRSEPKIRSASFFFFSFQVLNRSHVKRVPEELRKFSHWSRRLPDKSGGSSPFISGGRQVVIWWMWRRNNERIVRKSGTNTGSKMSYL